jgi:hypothetical protein
MLNALPPKLMMTTWHPHHDDVHRNEVVIPVDAHKDVKFVVKAAIVVLVPDLQPNQDIEDDSAHLVVRVGQKFGACEM